MAKYEVITASDVQDIMDMNSMVFTSDPWVLDELFVLPTKAWIEGEFSRGLKQYLANLKSLKYKKIVNDCDNFALNAWVFARACHVSTDFESREGSLPNAGIAFGVFVYSPSQTGPRHMRNFVICENRTLWFYEPQIRGIAVMTDEEKWECDRYAI